MLQRIVGAVLRESGPDLGVAPRPQDVAETAAYVSAALGSAPWHVRAAERCGRLALWTWLAAARGTPRGFARLSGPTATFVRLYRSLSVLSYAENAHVLAQLGREPAAARSARHRAKRQSALEDTA